MKLEHLELYDYDAGGHPICGMIGRTLLATVFSHSLLKPDEIRVHPAQVAMIDNLFTLGVGTGISETVPVVLPKRTFLGIDLDVDQKLDANEICFYFKENLVARITNLATPPI
jgi:hypothetical protein